MKLTPPIPSHGQTQLQVPPRCTKRPPRRSHQRANGQEWSSDSALCKANNEQNISSSNTQRRYQPEVSRPYLTVSPPILPYEQIAYERR